MADKSLKITLKVLQQWVSSLQLSVHVDIATLIIELSQLAVAKLVN